MLKHPSSLEGDVWLDEIEQAAHDFLTPERARLVRVLRVHFGCSWRAVAEHVADIFPESVIVGGHQIYGEALCRHAAQMLAEDPNLDPWN